MIKLLNRNFVGVCVNDKHLNRLCLTNFVTVYGKNITKHFKLRAYKKYRGIMK